MSILNNPSFKLATIILNKTKEFTIEEIIDDLKKVEINKDYGEVKRALNKLRDNDFITQFGSYYLKS